ncbi:spermatogenesis-associated protein 31D1-like, partial [Acomys russatus]|uniref:spermatogenesis-associated protein 31D1-like n=1 Tax=Acomys russatus TaxID=60746 RepID=UPI0021E312C7
WNSPGPAVIDQDTSLPKIGLKLKEKQGKFGTSDQLHCGKSLGGDLGQRHSQFFWGLPSLHSESIVATLLVPLSRYSLEPQLVLFNGVCKAATALELDAGSPGLPQPQPLPLSSVHPQPFPNAKPQPQTLAFTQVHPQARMQSPFSPMATPSLPCGSALQIPPNRTLSDALHGNEHLQHHLLQNHQESLWGLVPECQQYETAFHLVPSLPPLGQPAQTYASVPRTGHFHYSSGLQDNLEPYGPNNLIPAWGFQPYQRTRGSEVMDLQFKPTETSFQSLKYAKPFCSVHWGHSTGELSHSESFCERVSVKPPLRKDAAKNVGQILGKCRPLDSTHMISGCYALNRLRAVPETEGKWVCHSRISLENGYLNVSRKSLDQRQARSILRLHVSRKFWQITMGRIPINVCCSWLAQDVPPLWSSPLGNIYCNTSTPKIPFLDHKTRKMLEAHLIRFRVSQKWGLPLKVIESIKFYILREAKMWPLPQSYFPSSSNSISGVDLKSNFPSALRGSANKLGTANLASITDHLPLTVPHVDREGERSLRQSHLSSGYEVTEQVQTMKADRPTNLDTLSQNDTAPQNRPRQEQPAKEKMAGPESDSEMASTSSHAETTEDRQRAGKSPKHVLTPSMLREILTDEEVSILLSRSSSSSKWGSASKGNEGRTKPDSLVGTEYNPSGMSVPENPALSDFKKQLFMELKSKVASQAQSQTGGYESEASFASDSLTGYFPSSSTSVSSVDVSVFTDMHAHLYSTRISADPWQEPRVFKQIFKNLTPDLPECRKPNGRGDTPGLETSKAGKKSQPVKAEQGKKPQASESYFRKKMGQFFHWLHSSKDSTRHRSEKDRALFMSCGPPEAHELMASLGKLLEDKLLYGRKSELSEWNQKNLLPGPNRGAASTQHGGGTSKCPCPQTTISPGPSPTLGSIRRHPHVSFEKRPQFWSYLSSSDSRES